MKDEKGIILSTLLIILIFVLFCILGIKILFSNENNIKNVIVKNTFNTNISTENKIDNIENYNNYNNINSSSNNSSNVQTDIRKTYPINKKEQITTGFGLKCAVTVINYQTECNNSKLGKTESDQEFIIVNMKIENLGSEPLIISKDDFRLEDASGSRYYAAPRTLESELRQAEIGAGQSQDISIRFVFLKDFSKSIVMFPDVYYETTIKLK